MPAATRRPTRTRWFKRIGLGLLWLLAAAVVLGSVTEQVLRHHAHQAYPPRGQLVDVGGRRMHLDCRGAGSPTVILESGLDVNGSLSWDRVQDPLARLTRTCSYDRAGVMWSDAKPGPQDADAVADDLHALLAAAGIRPPLVMVCHSLGGPYLMDYTRRFGAEVQRRIDAHLDEIEKVLQSAGMSRDERRNVLDNVGGLVFVDCSHPDQLAKLGPKVRASTAVPFLYRALDALAWTGLARLVPDPPVPGMPERIRPLGRAYLSETLGGTLKEMAGIEATFREGGALRDLGDRPLVVLTAMQPYPADMLKGLGMTPAEGLEMQARWQALGRDEASWSRRSRQQDVPDSLHYIQFQRPDLVIAAVTDVVEAVRTGARPGSGP